MMGRTGTAGGVRRALGTVAVLALVASGCAITRVSVSSRGTEGSKASTLVLGVTDDGRYSLFLSDADNLVTGDTNGQPDVFRHDTTTGATVRVDVAGNGAQLAPGAYDGALSADGRYAAFVTDAALDAGDTNGSGDVYVRDLTGNTTTWASQPPPAGLVQPGSVLTRDYRSEIAISADGRYVSFQWQGGAFPPHTATYRRDRTAGTTTMVSESAYFDGMYTSADARHYVMQTTCYQGGCFPHPVLIDTDGSASGWPAVPFIGCSFASVGAMSAGGRYLVYWSQGGLPAPCLPRGSYIIDRTTGTASQPGNLGSSSSLLAVSRNGNAILFAADGAHLPNGTAGHIDLYLRDVAAGTDSRVGITMAGQEPDATITSTLLSSDGHEVAFASAADNLVPDDHNGVSDVFVRPGLARPAN